MKCSNKALIQVLPIVNPLFFFETFSSEDYTLVNQSAFLIDETILFSNFNFSQSSLGFAVNTTVNSLLAIGIAIIAIGFELMLAKKVILIKRFNKELKVKCQQLMSRNVQLERQLVLMENHKKENAKMIKVIAHDLRSPMAAIVGLSGFMIDEQKLHEEDLEVIQLIHTSGKDSLQFINEILERESLKIEPQKDELDIYELLNYCIAQLQYKAAEKQQTLKFSADAKPKVWLNRAQIWRVVCNLVTNAMKFSPNHSNIFISLKSTNKEISIAVTDCGIGIPAHLKDQIFGNSGAQCRLGTNGEKSFGLGLPTSKKIVESHGGSLSFESEVGKGTTFVITLPIA